MCIVARGNQNQLRGKLSNNGKDEITEKCAIKVIAGAGSERKIDGETLTRTGPDFREITCSWVKWILVGGKVE